MPSSTRSRGMSGLCTSSGNDVHNSWSGMTVAELKAELKRRGLPISGVKAALIQRLEERQQPATPAPPAGKKSKYFADKSLKGAASAISKTKSPRKTRRKSPPVTPDGKSANATETPVKRKSLSTTKNKSPPSSRKRVRIEPGSLAPPQNWEKIYKLVEELRSDRSAPVDTDGAEALPEKQHGPLVYRFQVLIALMLSSQTKDAVVGETMKSLQKHGLNVQNILNTDDATLNALIGKVGFHNNKTKYIKQAAEIIVSKHSGDIPPTAAEMMDLPGVGPKMAYIIEFIAFGTVSGIGVDTHMHRMFNDLNWVDSKTPESTREQLEGWLPRHHWGTVNYLWVGFGQEVQQQKEKSLRKALACSSPKDALGLMKKLKLDVKKEGKRHGLAEEINRVLNE